MRIRYKNTLRLIAAAGIILVYQNCAPGFSVLGSGSSNQSSSSSAVATSAKVRRLSNLEYKTSVIALVHTQIARHGNDAGILANIDYSFGTNLFSELPADALATKLGTDQIISNISSARFSAYTDIAYALATQFTTNSGWIQSMVGCASSDTTLTPACVDAFIDEFATPAFRTPPTPTERAELKSNLSNWHTLIARILVHPRFLLHFERDGVRADDGTYALTDYELEARLASLFWKSVPDPAGLAVAASGTLRTPAGLQAEIARILNSQKSHDTLWIYYQQWFAASRLPQADGYNSGTLWQSFAAEFLPNLSDQQKQVNFGKAVVEDAHQFLEYLTWTQPSKLEMIFRSPLIFTTDAGVAQIYGVTPRASAAAAPVADSSGHFGGILTRPFITQQKPSINGERNHIQRGVFILQNLLGLELGQPANFADQQQAQLVIPASSSTRQEVQAKTGQGACIACHTMINPAGYGLSHFDTLGRYSETETRYNYVNNAVAVVATNSVDSSGSLLMNGNSYQVADSLTLVDAMLGSGRLFDGFANYYFQFAFGHLPSSPSDLRLLTSLKANLKIKTIRASLEALAQHPDFARTQTVAQ